MPLRAYLSMLAVATLLPLALFAVIVGYLLVQQDRETFRQGAEARVLALLTAVDAELKGSIDAIEALSLTASLDDGDLAYFRETARRVLANQPNWININLARPDRQRVLDLLAPPGGRLAPITDDGEIARLLRERKPVVSNMAVGPTSRSANFAVRVPVLKDGEVRYVLSAVVKPEAIGRLLAKQNLPAEWVAVVLDRSDRIVARTVDAEGSLGKLASDSLREALGRSPSGWFRGSTIEGTTVYTPYRRSETSGWAFAMGIPATAVDAVAWRTATLLGAGLLAALLLALLTGRIVGRRLSAPIGSLAAATEAIGRGEPAAVPQSASIAEVRALARTLQECIDTIRERGERMRMALDAGRMGSWEWDVRTSEVKWSPELEAIHGLPPGAFGGTFTAFEKDVYPQDREKVQRAVAESLKPGAAEHQIEYRIVRPDGAVRWVEGRGKVFRDESGAPLRLVGVCTDVTDRKSAEREMRQAEERMRSVVDHVVDGIITIDEAGIVQTFNPAAERIFGYPSAEVIGQNVRMLMPEPYRREHDGYVGNYVRTGEAKVIGIGREVQGRRKDGTVFPLDLAISEFHTGGRRQFTGIVRDITERKGAEQALLQADRAKDEFIAMLSHELRNPLAALSAASHVLRRSPSGAPHAIKASAVVERQTAHMARLIEDLLDISRITMGKLALERQPLDFGRAVSAMVHAWRVAGRLEGRAKVAVDARSIWVDADPARLEQIVSNLLDNALKFTPAAGSVRVTVRQEAGDAVLRVADTGRGIEREALERVFEPFVQGTQDAARAEGGMGLGLALVKRLGEAHGGSVAVESEGAGRGATFTVRLPAVTGVAETEAAVVAGTRAGTRRILVIEDNTDAREMLRAALTLKGHEVREAPTGKAGIEAAAQMRPDVALIDIGLPDMDGYEVARRLRAASHGAPIGLIAITGYGQPDDQRRAYEAGFDLHLTKPVAAEELEQLMARLQ
jgi:PAS domain S-box-containing protein